MNAIPTCPRCGYDQSGAIAAWERNEPACCPLTGVCTECGLKFAWRDLLNESCAHELRMFEHALSRILRSFILTLCKAQRGWSFWRWVRMENPIVPWRLVWMLAIGAPLTILLRALIVGFIGGLHEGIGEFWCWYTGINSYYRFDGGRFVARAVWPFGDLEGFTGSFVSPLAMIAVVATVIMPATFALLPRTLRAAKVRRGHIVRVWVYGLIGFPLALAVPCVFAGLLSIMRIPRFTFAAHALWLLQSLDWWIFLGWVGMWMTAWWSWAVGRYLRLPRAWAIGLAMSVISLLAATLLVFAPTDHMWFFENV